MKGKNLMASNRVVDLTVDEFKTLLRVTLREAMLKVVDVLNEADEGLEFKPEVAEQLRNYLENGIDQSKLYSAEEVAKELGLDGYSHSLPPGPDEPPQYGSPLDN